MVRIEIKKGSPAHKFILSMIERKRDFRLAAQAGDMAGYFKKHGRPDMPDSLKGKTV